MKFFQSIPTLILLLVLSSACTSEEVGKEPEVEKERENVFPLTLKHELFEISTPEGFKLTREQGIDTYIGRITNGELTIYYDIGHNSFPGIDQMKEMDHYLYMEYLEVDGNPALMIKETRTDMDTRLSIFIDGGEWERNRLYVHDPVDDELIKEIFKTHRFTDEGL